MGSYAKQKAHWAAIARGVLKSHFGEESWRNRGPGGGCSKDSSAVKCDGKPHIRTYEDGIVLHRYRAGHGWQPLRVYTARPRGMSALRHTTTSEGSEYGDPNVRGVGGDTHHANPDGSTAGRTRTSPYWPESGDFDQGGTEIETPRNLASARETFAYDAWRRSNDEVALLNWANKIKCKKKGAQVCKRTFMSFGARYVVSNTYAGLGLNVPHSGLFVCIIVTIKCTPPRTTTPPDKPRKKKKKKNRRAPGGAASADPDTPKGPETPDTPKGPKTPRDGDDSATPGGAREGDGRGSDESDQAQRGQRGIMQTADSLEPWYLEMLIEASGSLPPHDGGATAHGAAADREPWHRERGFLS